MSANPVKAGRVRIDVKHLHVMLGLPPDHRILSVHQENDFNIGRSFLNVVVEGPSMPEVSEGECAPEVVLTYEQKPGEMRPRLTKVERLP